MQSDMNAACTFKSVAAMVVLNAFFDALEFLKASWIGARPPISSVHQSNWLREPMDCRRAHRAKRVLVTIPEIQWWGVPLGCNTSSRTHTHRPSDKIPRLLTDVLNSGDRPRAACVGVPLGRAAMWHVRPAVQTASRAGANSRTAATPAQARTPAFSALSAVARAHRTTSQAPTARAAHFSWIGASVSQVHAP